MNFTVEFFETKEGRCPMREFLDDMKQSDPGDFAAVLAGIEKLRDRRYHREPLSKVLGGGLLELRHVGKLNTRILWFFTKGRRIILLHGIRNKGRALAVRDIQTAKARMNDWLQRNLS